LLLLLKRWLYVSNCVQCSFTLNIGLEHSHHCSFILTFTLTPKWGLVLTHTLTHHSFYKSRVKVENDITVHIKSLILIVAQLSNS